MPDPAVAPSWLEQCTREALRCPELLEQFDRLAGTNLRLRGSPLDVQIDVSSGRLARDTALFVAFVHEAIASRLSPR